MAFDPVLCLLPVLEISLEDACKPSEFEGLSIALCGASTDLCEASDAQPIGTKAGVNPDSYIAFC